MKMEEAIAQWEEEFARKSPSPADVICSCYDRGDRHTFYPHSSPRSICQMGNDGGSIPTRRELVKEGARDLSTTQVKEIQTEQHEHYWSTCALSHEPLCEPVVSDALGTLYNKAAVLDHLLAEGHKEKATSREELEQKKEAFKDRLRSLKDVVEVRFHTDAESGKWTCPVTNKTLGPGTKAIYLVPCGHAFAESLIATVPGDTCLNCNELYTKENVILILPIAQADKDRLSERLEKLRVGGLTHSLKKALKEGKGGKKRKQAGPLQESETHTVAPAAVEEKGAERGIKNKDTAALTEKVLKEQEDRNKRRKIAGNENVESLFTKGEGMEVKKVDFMTRGFSVPQKR